MVNFHIILIIYIIIFNQFNLQNQEMQKKLNSKSQELTSIKFPQISPKLKSRVLCGIRPYRKGGIRLQTQKISNKIVVHNYGHGGAGVSLAPACALQVAQMVKSNSKAKTVAVLGSGIIGLFSALECANMGMTVTVYADRVPQANQKNTSKMITSQIAPGYWLPFNYEYSNLQQHKRRSQLSFAKYIQWTKKSSHIYSVQCFQQMSDELFDKSTPDFIKKQSKKMKVKIGNKQFQVINFKTLQLNLQLFLQDLIKQCRQKGVIFQKRHFDAKGDLDKLKQEIIVSCLGLYSKKIFGDQQIYGVKGHLIQLKNPTGLKAVFGFQFQGQFALYCLGDKTLIGLSRQMNQQMNINQKTVEMLENRAYKFMKHVGLDILPKM